MENSSVKWFGNFHTFLKLAKVNICYFDEGGRAGWVAHKKRKKNNTKNAHQYDNLNFVVTRNIEEDEL